MAARYGLTDAIKKDGFHKIMLPEDSPRGGLMTQAFFYRRNDGRSNLPIIRGAMVKEILLNSPPPPPPPNVPELVNLEVDLCLVLET